MREDRASLSELSSHVFDLGYVGEKNHTRVVIVCTAMFRQYPDAEVTMAVKPPNGDIYPVTVTKDGNTVVWAISEADIGYAGSGQFQLTFTDDGEVIKQAFGSFNIKPSLETTGEPPTPLEGWLERAEEALENFDQDVSDAEAYAVGTRGGTAVTSDDPAYHNNAKYFADHLNISVSGTKLIINS